MPRGNFDNTGVNTHGWGKQGYCKLCSIGDGDLQLAYDERCRAKWSPKQLNEWVTQKGRENLITSHVTIYKHRKHVMHPQDRMVTAVAKAEKRALQTTPQTSPDDFLAAVVSRGAQLLVERPEDVSMDHALRAASTLKQSKDNNRAAMATLMAALAGQGQITAPQAITVIEAEYTELEASTP